MSLKRTATIYLLGLWIALALSPAVFAQDPHLDLFPNNDDDAPNYEPFESDDQEQDQEPEGAIVATLEIPRKSGKPSTPPVFSAATNEYKGWKSAAVLPEAPKPEPARAPAAASVPSETKELTEAEMEKETEFQQNVLEASVVPSTYRRILNALTSGQHTPRPIKDTGR